MAVTGHGRRRRAILAFLALSATLTAAAAGYATGTFAFRIEARVHPQPPPDSPPPSLADVAAAALSRVVTVEGLRGGGEISLGTGWLFDGHGDFVTNAHVVNGQLALRLRDRTDRTYGARVVGTDTGQDVAVVRADGDFPGPPLPVGPTTRATREVAVIASARATGHADVTFETVAGTRSVVVARGNPDLDPGGSSVGLTYHDMLLVQGRQIFAGNSGGPVLDQAGMVVGLVTLASRNSPSAYAIPLSRVAIELRGFSDRS